MTKPAAHSSAPQLLAGPRWQSALGIVLLAIWLIWWGLSLSLNVPSLIAAGRTYMIDASWPYLGFDFLHEYAGGQALAHGNNPYQSVDLHPLYHKFQLPPAMLPLFSWCALFPPDTQLQLETPAGTFTQAYPFKAVALWFIILTAIFGFAAYAACQTRKALNLGTLSWPLALAMILLSYPVMFTFERGASDPLILLLILFAVAALQKNSARWQIAAGLCLALAAWLKLYPALLILALLGLRRWRAALSMLAGILAITLLSLPWLGQWMTALNESPNVPAQLPLASHSLINGWPLIWKDALLAPIGQLPAQLGAALFVLIPALLVTWFIFRTDRRNTLALPYLLWLTALATFGPTLLTDSPDYNLFFLLLAALTAWHWRDPIWVHIPAVYLLFWWQPFLIAQSSEASFLFKILATLAIGLSLIAKTSSSAKTPASPQPHP